MASPVSWTCVAIYVLLDYTEAQAMSFTHTLSAKLQAGAYAQRLITTAAACLQSSAVMCLETAFVCWTKITEFTQQQKEDLATVMFTGWLVNQGYNFSLWLSSVLMLGSDHLLQASTIYGSNLATNLWTTCGCLPTLSQVGTGLPGIGFLLWVFLTRQQVGFLLS